MRTTTSKIGVVKEYLLSEEVRKGLLALLVLVILDAVIAVVGAALMSQPFLLVLSNALFLEGALAFAVGAFVALVGGGRKRRETEEEAELPNERAEDYVDKETTSVHMPFGPLLMLLGAILMVLSVIAGLLLF